MPDPAADAVRFSAPFRVRFDEAAPGGLLRTSSVLRYAQDLAWQHSAHLGFDRTWYGEVGITWLVRTAGLAVLAPIEVGSALTGTTSVVGFRRVWSRRHSAFTDASGAVVATADIDWVLIDARGAPTRIPVEVQTLFGAPAATFPLGRVALGEPPADAVGRPFTVRPQELDPMDHVNNAVYADWLDEALIDAGHGDETRTIPRLVRLEYAAAAAAGERLDARLWASGDGWSYRVTGPDGTDVLRARWEAAPGDLVVPGRTKST